jgi:hypothetical protein
VGCCYAAGAFSFWSVLGLFLDNDNNGVVFSLGSVPRWYFLWGPFRGIYFGVRSEGIFLCLLLGLLGVYEYLRPAKFPGFLPFRLQSDMLSNDTSRPTCIAVSHK